MFEHVANTRDLYKMKNVKGGYATVANATNQTVVTFAETATEWTSGTGATSYFRIVKNDNGFDLQHPGDAKANAGNHVSGKLGIWNHNNSATAPGSRIIATETTLSTSLAENKSEAEAIINTLGELAGESAKTTATTALNSLPADPMEALGTIKSTLATFYESLTGKKFTYRSEMNGGTHEAPRYMKAVSEDAALATSLAPITARNVFEFENISANTFKIKVPYFNNVYLNSVKTAASGSTYDLHVFGDKVALQFHGTGNAIHHQASGNLPVSWETAADASKWYIAPVSYEEWATLSATPDFEGLRQIINVANNYSESIGSELQQFSWIVDGQNKNSEWASALSEYQAIVDAATASVEEVNTAKANAEQMLQQLQINQPKNNSLIRIRSVGTGQGYLQAETANNKGIKVSDETGKASMFFFADGKLLSYNTGYYLANKANFINMGTTPGEACSIRFGEATKHTQTCYTVIFNGNRHLYAANNATGTDAGSSEGNANYDFTLEYVTQVPIAMNELNGEYYATLQLPVAVILPTSMKAYKVTAESDDALKLEVVAEGSNGGVLAANTPVILYSTANVENLAVSESEGTQANDNLLSGTVATISAPANSYVLSGKNDEVGFYKYVPTTDLMPGFKAYLSSESTSNKFSFVFNDDDLTAIASAVKGANNKAAIYDIQGRKVATPVKGSVYIQGGKKIVY